MTWQLSLFQLDDYGPWTTTPAPRPEMDLQSLQSRLYADVAEFVGARDGYAFAGRGDNMVAVTDGMDREAHRRLQERVRNRFPVTVSAGVGTGATPASALGSATEALQRAGSAQDAGRREALVGSTLDDDAATLQVGHFDVVDATGEYTDTRHAFDAHLAMDEGVAGLRSHLRRDHDALAFFVGGDNVVACCPDLSRGTFDDVVETVHDRTGVRFRVGVGTGRRAREAGMAAKHALESARETGRAVCLDGATATTR